MYDGHLNLQYTRLCRRHAMFMYFTYDVRCVLYLCVPFRSWFRTHLRAHFVRGRRVVLYLLRTYMWQIGTKQRTNVCTTKTQIHVTFDLKGQESLARPRRSKFPTTVLKAAKVCPISPGSGSCSRFPMLRREIRKRNVHQYLVLFQGPFPRTTVEIKINF